MRPTMRQVSGWLDRIAPAMMRGLWWEALLGLAVFSAAAFLRLRDLTTFPAGLHGDEAITGIEGRRILDEGWIGPYSPLALGQPSGPLYLTAASVWLLGNTVLAVRLVPALLSTLTVFALFVLCRRNVGPRTAVIVAALLAVMGWHVHYARIGFPLSAWPLSVVLAVIVLLEADRRDTWRWWVLAGVTAAAGIYAYNAHLLFLGLLGGFVVVRLLVAERSWRHRLTRLGAFGGALVVAALPMARFAADPANGYFNHARHVSVFQQESWTSLQGRWDRLHFLGERYASYWRQVCCEPRFDGTDATGVTPLVPPAMLLLAAVGVVLGLWHRRGPLLAVGLLTILLMPLAAVGTLDGAARRTFAIAPFVAMFAGLGIAEGLRLVRRARAWVRVPVVVLLLVVSGAAVFRNLANEFGALPGSSEERWVFAHELTEATRFMRTLPPDSYVYFYSDRWSIDYETRQFLAPDVRGEDRSDEFGHFSLSVDPAQGRPVFVFVGSYRDLLPAARQRYLGGTTVEGSDDAVPTFVAYVLGPDARPADELPS